MALPAAESRLARRRIPGRIDAQQVDLDGDGKPDLLVEDLDTFIPGEPVKFHMKLLNAKAGSALHAENHAERQDRRERVHRQRR